MTFSNHSISNSVSYVSSTLTDTVASTVVPANPAYAFHLTGGWVTNSNGSVGTDVEILMGGVVVAKGHAAAGGQGFLIHVGPGCIRGAKDAAWSARCVSDSTTVIVTLVGFQSPAT